MKHILLFLLFFPIVLFAQSRSAGKPSNSNPTQRYALVIGNEAYQYNTPLKNPANDAKAMTEALRKLGFEVSVAINSDLRVMNKSINEWVQKLGTNDISLFYFAGHGAEIDGENYLFPIDANPKNKADVEFEAYPVSRMLGKLATTKVLTNIILLDACRNNPFVRSWSRNVGDVGGLANMNAPKGTFIGFAATPGATASDGTRTNGLYTEAILKAVQVPNLTIDQIFNQVNKYVRIVSGGGQIPFKSSSLEDDFYFSKTSNGKELKSTPLISDEDFSKLTTRKFMDIPFAEMVKVPGGTFEMGSDNGREDEKPAHKVKLNDFYMGKYEITVAQFRAFIESTNFKTEAEIENSEHRKGSDILNDKGENVFDMQANWRYNAAGKLRSSDEDSHPVIHVSWNDAVAFCEWLSKREGKLYRLPTEAEWEYAAGNGVIHSKFSWGEEYPTTQKGGNVADNSLKKNFVNGLGIVTDYTDGYIYTAPVGSFAANKFEIYDLSGNVFEWCQDWYDPKYYSKSPLENPLEKIGGFKYPPIYDPQTPNYYRVLRGGSWIHQPQLIPITNREYYSATVRTHYIGFRIVSQ